MTRREAARVIGVAGAAVMLQIDTGRVDAAGEPKAMLARKIPSSGEELPVIGLGTWKVFDVDPSQIPPLEPVVARFVELGGRVIDSSPMYGRAEEVIGELTDKLHLRNSIFFATKVWTRGKEAGVKSMEQSLARLQTQRIDLMQVHNLVDVETQLATMREWKAAGRLRYIGITHYEAEALPQLERILEREKVDFVQVNYSITEPEADQRLLPLAGERGIAVIANRPFGGGNLFGRVRGKALPEFSRDFDCESWAQFFLKWIVAQAAVTCAIPATNNFQHLQDNMHAGFGRLPNAQMRRRMIEVIRAL